MDERYNFYCGAVNCVRVLHEIGELVSQTSRDQCVPTRVWTDFTAIRDCAEIVLAADVEKLFPAWLHDRPIELNYWIGDSYHKFAQWIVRTVFQGWSDLTTAKAAEEISKLDFRERVPCPGGATTRRLLAGLHHEYRMAEAKLEAAPPPDELVTIKELALLSQTPVKSMQNKKVLPPSQPRAGKTPGRYNYREARAALVKWKPELSGLMPESFSEAKKILSLRQSVH